MNIKNENIISDILNICSLIHSVSKLDIEFIDANANSALKLSNLQSPSIIQPSRLQTTIFIDNFLRTQAPNNFLFHTDTFKLSYLGIGLWEDNIYKGTIIAGPFLSDIPDEVFISSIIENNKLTIEYREIFSQYYKVLNILALGTYKDIGNMMVNLTAKPFIYADILTAKNENFTISKKEKYAQEKEKLYSEIELNYKLQKQLINAVEKGSKENAIKFFNLLRFNPTHRVPNNPLRASKNLAFSFSSGLKTAADRGGVSPIHIHNISDLYAILIEKVSSFSELETLKIKMISDYCDLVKNQAITDYSPNICKAIEYINLYFDSTLSLNIIAGKINLNPSHLSRQFKNETGLTITDYINTRRIEEAKLLIEQNDASITEIALMVGFTNPNYFSTVFKQITTLTPSEYLNRSKGKK
jgi:YesN/AraC family two-component response regulator